MESNESKCGGGGKSCAFQLMILSKSNESIIFPVPGAGFKTWWQGRTGMRRMCVVLVIEKDFSPVVGGLLLMVAASKVGYRKQERSEKGLCLGEAMQCNEQASYHCLLPTLPCFLDKGQIPHNCLWQSLIDFYFILWHGIVLHWNSISNYRNSGCCSAFSYWTRRQRRATRTHTRAGRKWIDSPSHSTSNSASSSIF